MSERICDIVSASVELENGSGDGAYDLLDVMGTPEEVGQKIIESLKETDIYSGRCPSHFDAGYDIYLVLKIKVSKKPEPEPEESIDYCI